MPDKLISSSGNLILKTPTGSQVRQTSEESITPMVITGNNTLSFGVFYTCDSATPTTQTLPAATGSNKTITVENTGTALLTVDGNASETINGSLNQVIGQYQSLKVRDYAAGKWIVMH